MKTVWKNKNTGKYTVLDVGRNELCPCGSKMKFKHCCTGKVAVPILGAKPKSAIRQIKDIELANRINKNNRVCAITRSAKRYNAKMARRAL